MVGNAGDRMRLVVAEGPGVDGLRLDERPLPEPADDELLVRVHTIGMNRSDLKQRQRGRAPEGVDTDILGIEFAGTVVTAGARTTRFDVGRTVCGLVPGGAYAEYVAVHERHVLPLPAGTDAVSAAAVPEAYLTAWSNLIVRGGLAEGERVLIHGGSSGVGTAAIQLARRAGAQVLVTASSRRKLDACAKLGAVGLIDYTQGPFEARVLELTDGAGVDVVLDLVGAPYVGPNLGVLRPEGRLVLVSLLGGREATFDLSIIQSKRLTVTGSRLRSRSVEARSALTRGLEEQVWPGFADGDLQPVVDRVLSWEKVAAAHRYMEQGDHIGKILLRVEPPASGPVVS